MTIQPVTPSQIDSSLQGINLCDIVGSIPLTINDSISRAIEFEADRLFELEAPQEVIEQISLREGAMFRIGSAAAILSVDTFLAEAEAVLGSSEFIKVTRQADRVEWPDDFFQSPGWLEVDLEIDPAGIMEALGIDELDDGHSHSGFVRTAPDPRWYAVQLLREVANDLSWSFDLVLEEELCETIYDEIELPDFDPDA